MSLLAVAGFAAADFSKADSLFEAEDYAACGKVLESMLPQAASNADKAGVLWRLARLCVVTGQAETTKDGKKAAFDKGIAYAQEAIDADPSNRWCYMWHCANVGRACQLLPLMEQAAAVPTMTGDLSTILDRLGKTSCSEAWQALAEIYFNHPFKSNDSAINFTRKAVMTIPAGEIRVATYGLLAEKLYDRNWSASRRSAEAAANADKFKRKGKSNIEKFSYFDGSLGADYVPAWSDTPLGSLSDRQEAALLLDYALNLYRKSGSRSSIEAADYATFKALRESWK